MLKKLPINRIHQSYLHSFEKYIKVSGYGSYHQLLSPVRELFYRIEREGKELAQLTSADIAVHQIYLENRPSYRDGGALSMHTISSYFFALQVFFVFAQKTGLMTQNPMGTLSLPAIPKTHRQILTKAEITKLYEVCKTVQEKAILGMFYGCGLRRSEGEKLNLRDIDFKGAWLYIRSGKGKKRRVIPLTQNLIRDFKNYRYDQRPLQITEQTKGKDQKAFMLNSRGRRMLGNTYWKLFKGILKRSKIDKKVSLHQLRHSIATHLLQGGMSIEQVRDFLGHQFLESTQIYTHINPSDL